MMRAKCLDEIVYIIAGMWVLATIGCTAPPFVTAIKERGVVLEEFEQFSRALVGGRYQDAYEYCGRGFRANTTFERFVANLNTLGSRHGKLAAIHQRGITVSIKESEEDWAAVIKADFEFERATRRVILEYHHEEGRWVVFGFKETGPS